MREIYELMKEVNSRILTMDEIIAKDPDNADYARGRKDAYLNVLESCLELTKGD